MNPVVAATIRRLTETLSGFEPENSIWMHLDEDVVAGPVEALERDLTPECREWTRTGLSEMPFKDIMLVHTVKSRNRKHTRTFVHSFYAPDAETVITTTREVYQFEETVSLLYTLYVRPAGATDWVPSVKREIYRDERFGQFDGEPPWDQGQLALAQLFKMLQSPQTVYKLAANPSNKKRVAKGKKPLYDWTTVVIKPVVVKSAPQGGTHASPRPHERRGHAFTRNGKKFWRRSTIVRRGAEGFVFKDYAKEVNK